MHNFIAVFCKSASIRPPQAEDFYDLLPLTPVQIESFVSGPYRLFSYRYKESPNPGIIKNRESAFAFDGIIYHPTARKYSAEHAVPLSEGAVVSGFSDWTDSYRRVDGEYSIVSVNGDGIRFQSNIGGSHNLYYLNNHRYFAVCNRSPMILGLDQFKFELDIESIRWKAFQGYVGNLGTAIQGVAKLPNGSFGRVCEKESLRISRLNVRALFDERQSQLSSSDITDKFEAQIQGMVNYANYAHQFCGSRRIEVPLSGGKDSRVLLSILKQTDLLDNDSIVWTRGNRYSPDCLAASDIAKTLRLDQHEIRMPGYISSQAISTNLICNTLNNHEAMLSLFDFAGIAVNSNFRVQGHQNALRPGRYSWDCSQNIEEFLKFADGKWFNDPLNLLVSNSDIKQVSSEFFSTMFQEGARIEDLGDLFYLFDRNPNWVAVISAADYLCSAITNPLMADGLFRFIFQFDSKLRSIELFHFLALYINAPEWVDIPFADDQWSEKTFAWVRQSGLTMSGLRGRPTAAYKSHPSFPNAANPYITNIKLTYYNGLKEIAKDILAKNKQEISQYMHVDVLKNLLCSDEPLSFQKLYTAMGVISSLLMIEYGDAIFRRSAHADIRHDLFDRLESACAPVLGGKNAPKMDELDNRCLALLDLNERAIEALVRERQNLDSQLTDYTS